MAYSSLLLMPQAKKPGQRIVLAIESDRPFGVKGIQFACGGPHVVSYDDGAVLPSNSRDKGMDFREDGHAGGKSSWFKSCCTEQPRIVTCSLELHPQDRSFNDIFEDGTIDSRPDIPPCH